MHQINKILVSIAMLLASNSHSAMDIIPADTINIEADKALIDEKKGLSTYTGNVVLKQQGMKINAEQIEFIGNARQFDKLIAYGNPVIFHRPSSGQKSTMTAKAKRIEYFADSNIVTFFGQAELSQGGNQFSGDRIEYNIKSGTVTASMSEQGERRVRVTLQPGAADNPSIGADHDN